MANTNLANAKSAKNDEFYTQYADIQKEINAYLDYDPNVFRGKTVLLPCDDPEWSNFTKFFAQNFELLGLKKLISTSYAPESKKYKMPYQPTLFETQQPYFDNDKSKTHGKIFVLTHDVTGDNRIDINDLQWQYLEGDGDFRSKEIKALRDKADIIVTNPPFSLFKEFMAWLIEASKKFIIIGNKNCITYKEIFPLIRDNKMWVGRTPMTQDLLFEIPKSFESSFVNNGKNGSNYKIVEGKILGRSTSSSGSIELPLTGKQIKSICTTGDNDVAVDVVVDDVKVQEWLGKYSDEQIRRALEEYGNWSDKELTDLKSNMSRLVWMMAWDIFDSDDPNESLAIDEMQ